MKHSLSTDFTLKPKVKIHSSNYLLSYNYVLIAMLDTIFFFFFFLQQDNHLVQIF